jgi:phosphoribosylanthranilate isomerase
MQAKICGVKDKKTLKYIVSHSFAPKFIGFICNYKKSKRFLQFNKLKNLLTVNKKYSKYVAVLVKPTRNELEKFSLLPFDYFQVYDMSANELKFIKKKYKIKVIAAITINNKKDVLKYREYKNIADIILFDSKGYEKSMSFDHKLIKNLRTKKKIMLAGNIQVDDALENYKKITDIIDISGGLETSGLKDVSKINIFLKKIKLIKNEN